MNSQRDPDAQRRRELGVIHQAKKQLGLDDDVYRSFLLGVTGKDSSADMTELERGRVLDAFIAKGFVAPTAPNGKRAWPGRPKDPLCPMLRKVEAILTDARRPWSYAHDTAKQMYQVKRVEWLRSDQLHDLVAAMQIDANRRKGKARG